MFLNSFVFFNFRHFAAYPQEFMVCVLQTFVHNEVVQVDVKIQFKLVGWPRANVFYKSFVML